MQILLAQETFEFLAAGRGLNFNSILGIRPRSCVLSVLEMATPLREILILLDTLISSAVWFLPLKRNYYYFLIMNSVFKRMLATLYLGLLCVFWGQCWFYVTSLSYLCRRENPTHLCLNPSNPLPLTFLTEDAGTLSVNFITETLLFLSTGNGFYELRLI